MASPRGLAVAFGVRTGAVTAFDDHVGTGAVRDGETADIWSFHATSITDLTRTISVGAEVTFSVRPGPVGLEAFALTPRG